MTASLNLQIWDQVNITLPPSSDARPPSPPSPFPPPSFEPGAAGNIPPGVAVAAEADDYDILDSDFGRPASETSQNIFTETTIVHNAEELAAVRSRCYVTLVYCHQ